MRTHTNFIGSGLLLLCTWRERLERLLTSDQALIIYWLRSAVIIIIDLLEEMYLTVSGVVYKDHSKRTMSIDLANQISMINIKVLMVLVQLAYSHYLKHSS